MGSASLPKWEVLQPEQATSLYFGFTAPTIAVSALAVLLCLFIEATRTLSAGDRRRTGGVQPEQSTRRRHWSESILRRWPFFAELILSNWSLPSRLLYGVLEFENELSYICM